MRPDRATRESNSRKEFKPGDMLVARVNEDNADYLKTKFGPLIKSMQQRYFPNVDSDNTHLAMLTEFIPEGDTPPDGFTPAMVFDTIIDAPTGATIHHLERNYEVLVARFKPGVELQAGISSDALAAKAVEVIQSFQGMRYYHSTVAYVMFDMFKRWATGYLMNDTYVAELITRFGIDFDNNECRPDKAHDHMICIEIVIASYQIAWLLLAGKEAANQPLPNFLNIHHRSTPGQLVKHFEAYPDIFDIVDADKCIELIQTGSKHETEPPDNTPKIKSRRLQL